MFSARLVNPPHQDPGVYVELDNEPASYLIDCGTLNALRMRDVHRIRRVFVSHTHIDHFIGLDHLVRMQLFSDATLEIYGPPGLARQVEAKLGGYAWNLVSESPYAILVHELGGTSTLLRCREQFAASPAPSAASPVVLLEGVQLRWAPVEHGVPCLAYCLVGPDRLSVDRQAVQELGLQPGPWLAELKRRHRERAAILEGHPVGELADRILRKQPGPRLGYVTDTLISKRTMKDLIALMQGADVLFCEASYLNEQLDLAREHLHMTARQAGRLAHEAGVGKLHLFHFSRRYQGETAPHLAEAGAVCPAVAPAPVYGGQ